LSEEVLVKPVHLYINSSQSEIQSVSLSDFEFNIYTHKSPQRPETELNQDSAAIIRYDANNFLALVADGVGGHQKGDEASRLVIETFIDEFNNKANKLLPIREFILKCFDLANQKIKELKNGSATTLVLAHLQNNTVRFYHAGDSEAFIIGDRGKLKYKTIPHSPTGHGIEAGLIDPEALDHPDRHIINNVLGSSDMRIEIGPSIELSKRDHIILCSDGLTDNFSPSDISTKIESSSFDRLCLQLVEDLNKRYSQAETPVKYDDTTIITIRQINVNKTEPTA